MEVEMGENQCGKPMVENVVESLVIFLKKSFVDVTDENPKNTRNSNKLTRIGFLHEYSTS